MIFTRFLGRIVPNVKYKLWYLDEKLELEAPSFVPIVEFFP